MKHYKSLIFIALVAGIGVVFVPALGFGASISLMGLADSSYPTANNKTVSNQTAYGGEALIDFPMARRLSLESGAGYFTRNWSDTAQTGKTVGSQVLEVPVLFRIHLRFLSFGFGGYYQNNQGSLTINSASATYGSYGINPYNFGLAGDVGIHLPLSRGVALRFDARYEDGVFNAATSTSNSFRYNDLQILGGLTFSLGGDMREGGRDR